MAMTNITIDRDQNIIVNSDGIAHFTHWIAVGAHSMHNKMQNSVSLVHGYGYYSKGTHWYKETGTPAWQGTLAELTFDLFMKKTLWKPDQI